MEKPPARKPEGNGISGNNYLKQRNQSLNFQTAFGHLATLRLRGNLKASQISLDIFTEWNLVYLPNTIARFPINSTGVFSSGLTIKPQFSVHAFEGAAQIC